MTKTILATYDGAVLRPAEPLPLPVNAQVEVTLNVPDEGPAVADGEQGMSPEERRAVDDPLADLRISTGIPDLAENFDDYRFGLRTP